jgi:UDP-glucuronate decarboxylase
LIEGLSRRVRARLLFASTSEVYGDPEVHPQKETYFGNVNPFGPRSCYDESKRVAEAMCYAYAQQVFVLLLFIVNIYLDFLKEGISIRIARIFNTYGPRMHMNDGRVVSNFVLQALQNEPITVKFIDLKDKELCFGDLDLWKWKTNTFVSIC